MALASTTWDDFSPGRPAWAAIRRRQTSAGNAAALGALAAVCTVAATFVGLHTVNVLRSPAHQVPAANFAPIAAAHPIAAPVPLLARNAQVFLADSLWLAEHSAAGRARAAAEIAQAKKLGRFG